MIGSLDITASLYIINITDAKNEVTVFRGTGEADNTGWLSTASGQAWAALNGPTAVELYKKMEQNPGNYGIPRQFRLGFRVEY
jgi:hypothetical protein